MQCTRCIITVIIRNIITKFDKLIAGVYGEDYTPCTLLTLIKLPVVPTKLIKQVPQALVDAIKDILQSDSSYSVEFYLSACTQPRPGECQKFMCSNWNEVNMMYHTWLYSNEKFTDDLNVSSGYCLFVAISNGTEISVGDEIH